MGKIQPNPSEAKGDDLEVRDDLPAFVPGENEDEPGITEEGTPIVPTDEGEEGEPEKPKYTFKTDEELNAFIDSKKKAEKPPAPPAPPVPPKKDEDEDPELAKLVFWKGARDAEGNWVGEKPADWNDFARTIIKHLSPQAYAPKVLEEIRNMTAKEKQELEQINSGFDVEYDELAAQGLVPARTTKEGQDINAQISQIGAEYGQTSMKKAHELWAKIPKDQGGGFGTAVAPKKVNPSKDVSRLIGSSKQTQAAGKPRAKIPYAKLHSARSVDDLIDEI